MEGHVFSRVKTTLYERLFFLSHPPSLEEKVLCIVEYSQAFPPYPSTLTFALTPCEDRETLSARFERKIFRVLQGVGVKPIVMVL